MHHCCAGLDVRRDNVVACVGRTVPGGRVENQVNTFATTTGGLLKLGAGIDCRAAQNILAEIGTNISRFPIADHLASWASLCPANNQNADKRRSGRMNDGNRWLKATLNQCIWAPMARKTATLPPNTDASPIDVASNARPWRLLIYNYASVLN